MTGQRTLTWAAAVAAVAAGVRTGGTNTPPTDPFAFFHPQIVGMTAVVEDPARGLRYLVYINRSQVDVLGGLFGGVKRKLIEGRLTNESATVVRTIHQRLESGGPDALMGSW